MEDKPPLAVQSDKGTEIRTAPFQLRDIHLFTSENDDIKFAMVESQHHQHGTSQGELDQCGAYLGAPVLAIVLATSEVGGRHGPSSPLAR